MNGGLDLATAELFGATVAWHVEYDTAPSKILAHHWPDVPNYGDVTTVDWSSVEPVDIITGGSPCQDLSAAGKRAGMTEGTRSNLWVNMRHAIDQLRPSYVLWENVLGALSAPADSASDMVPDAGPLGNPGDGHLRALGRVLGDLAEIGYDARWTTVRASDVGAPHHRARVFLLATPSDTDGRRLGEGAEQPGASAAEIAAAVRGHGPLSGGGRTDDVLDLLPTPTVGNANGTNKRRGGARSEELLLPGVAVAAAEGEYLPTPRARQRGDCPSERARKSPDLGSVQYHFTPERWGKYAPAIHRWEQITRPAPPPTGLNTNGTPELSARFAEWMMGPPGGWITDPAIWTGYTAPAAREAQLRAIGNGVCPQQAYAAGVQLLAMEVADA